MAIDREGTRAAKARRRAQRLAMRATSRSARGQSVLTRLPLHPLQPGQPEQPEETGPKRSEETQAPSLGTWGPPQLPEHFVTSDALAEHGSEAERLQAEVAGVRQILDRPLPPLQARQRRPRFWLWLGALLVLAAVAVVLAVVVDGRDSQMASPQATLPAASASPVPSATVGGSVVGLPSAGPGINEAGAALGIQVLADQSIAVTEQAVLKAPGPGSFSLSLPSVTLPPGAPKLDPVLRDLDVTINGSHAAATQTDDRHWAVVSPVGGARTVLLTYRLANAWAVSQPSVRGRALALVTPLLAQLLHGGNQPVDLLIPADGVSNVVCPGAPQAESLCGAHQGTNWHVTVPDDASSAAVLLQLDLR